MRISEFTHVRLQHLLHQSPLMQLRSQLFSIYHGISRSSAQYVSDDADSAIPFGTFVSACCLLIPVDELGYISPATECTNKRSAPYGFGTLDSSLAPSPFVLDPDKANEASGLPSLILRFSFQLNILWPGSR